MEIAKGGCSGCFGVLGSGQRWPGLDPPEIAFILYLRAVVVVVVIARGLSGVHERACHAHGRLVRRGTSELSNHPPCWIPKRAHSGTFCTHPLVPAPVAAVAAAVTRYNTANTPQHPGYYYSLQTGGQNGLVMQSAVIQSSERNSSTCGVALPMVTDSCVILAFAVCPYDESGLAELPATGC